MSAHPPASPPVLFEAVCTAHRSLDDQGMKAVALLVVAGSAAVAALVAALGAWPIIGFTGLEAVLVIGLLARHRRGALRAVEVLAIAGDRLVVRRTDARGRRNEVTLDPYWARVSLEERRGTASRLVLIERRRGVEVGALLGDDERRELAAMLADALRRYREPVFDNPQLRE